VLEWNDSFLVAAFITLPRIERFAVGGWCLVQPALTARKSARPIQQWSTDLTLLLIPVPIGVM